LVSKHKCEAAEQTVRIVGIETASNDLISQIFTTDYINRIFPGGSGGRGVGLTPHPYLLPKVLKKSRAIPLLTLRAFVAYKKGENLPI